MRDQPTFLAAAEGAARGLALFVLDPALLDPSGAARRTVLYRCLRALDESLDGRLLVVRGDPADVVPRIAAAVDARQVHVAADFGPYGRARDEAVEKALAEHGRALVAHRLALCRRPRPRHEARRHAVQGVHPLPPRLAAARLARTRRHRRRDGELARPGDKQGGPRGVRIPDDDRVDAELPDAGEDAARQLWRAFVDDGLAAYKRARDRPDKPGTSRMSVHLKYGTVHPRTLLADLGGSAARVPRPCAPSWPGASSTPTCCGTGPTSARDYDPRFDRLPWRRPGPRPTRASPPGPRAAPASRSSTPGCASCSREGWMHNRVRMIVASFLVKDLHVDWPRGARHFMRAPRRRRPGVQQARLAVGGRHGHRRRAVLPGLQPRAQGEKFDPQGDYVRRFVPELRELTGKAVHRPWELPGGPPDGYPRPIVDHAEERKAALERYEQVRSY